MLANRFQIYVLVASNSVECRIRARFILKWNITGHAISERDFLFVNDALVIAIYRYLGIVNMKFAKSLIIVNLVPVEVFIDSNSNIKTIDLTERMIRIAEVILVYPLLQRRLFLVDQ